MAGEREQNRDLTIAPESYLYMQNIGKGGILTVYRGPTVVNQTGQDQPVRYDAAKREYVTCGLDQAVRISPRAAEGDYIQLEGPSEDGTFPRNTSQQAVPLKQGRKVNIPGPWCEALWPGQVATTIEGHRLRSNQYLVAIVYNAEEAEKNWDTGTVVKVQTEDAEGKTKRKAKGLARPETFAVGTRIVITGSDVSFFIPCTGVEVLKDEKNSYVRDAVTLEQSEYACLIDESGKREFPRGPAVIFPSPTQVFETDKKGRRKFKPIELNTINGLHLKVTADFVGEDLESAPGADGQRPQRQYREGEELFVTGNTLSIFYPKEQLAIIEYGQGNKKHFSTAVPKGEGRYVISRQTGKVELVKGPQMLLPDPRFQIQVRRALSDSECGLMYPNNAEALTYNRELRGMVSASPSGRSGVISEGDYRKGVMRGLTSQASVASLRTFEAPTPYEPEEVGDEGDLSETISRSGKSRHTVNTKFDGVPRIEIWPGYAVLVVGAEGARRVVVGPQVVLLEYDERLGAVHLSTGKPKTTDKLYSTAYLMVQSNQVSDIVAFESSDHVKGKIKISLRVNFEGDTEEDQLAWFSVDNYVKFLTDHVRSLIGGASKRKPISEIKSNYVDLVRNTILGTKATPTESRPGLYFEANRMRVVEVEVLEITLDDPKIAKLLDDSQHQVVESQIRLETARRNLDMLVEEEGISRKTNDEKAKTQKAKFALDAEIEKAKAELALIQFQTALAALEAELKKEIEKQRREDLVAEAVLARAKQETDHRLNVNARELALTKDRLSAETQSAVDRFNAAKDGLYEALVSLGRDEVAVKLAEATNIERFISGDSVSSSIAHLLAIAPGLKAFFDKGTEAQAKRAGNGNRLTTQETLPARHS